MRIIAIAVLAVGLSAPSALAQQKPAVDPARADAVIKSAFPNAPADWQSRLVPDETMRACSAHHNNPPRPVADAIQQREKITIAYPADGKLMGEWQKGERIAQSGYGLRFTDYPARGPNGGNCYACHQMTKAGGQLRHARPEPPRTTASSAISARPRPRRLTRRSTTRRRRIACSNMPRFGTNKVLTIEQIKDVVALLMSPDSPVNK